MMTWFRRLLPREDRFFDLFEQHAGKLVQGSRALERLLSGSDVAAAANEIIALEEEADELTRQVLLAVRRSFVTPFDRSDIQDLVQSMDDAIDNMRKLVKTVTLFEQTRFEPLMREMGTVIVEAADLTQRAIPLLARVSANAPALTALTENMIRIEERADLLHERGLKELFIRVGRSDPMAYVIGNEIYGQLEKIVDRFEDVANEVNGIVIENV